MKKLLLLFLVLFSFKAYANDVPSLAEVLEWKYGYVADTCQADPNDSQPYPKMVICGWHSDLPRPTDEQIAEFTQEYYESQAYKSLKFSPDKFETDLWNKFYAGQFSFSMRNEASNLKEFSKRKNFLGMKQYLNILLLNSAAQQSDVNNVKACLESQGINLDLWS